MRLFLVFVLLILISGCANEKTSYTKKEVTAKENKYGSVGSKIALNGISYTVEKVESSNEIGESSVSKKASGIFYLVYFKIENKGEHDYIFSPRINMIDSNDKKYLPDLKAGFYLSNLIQWDKTVFPGGAHSGIIVFDVPENEENFEIEIYDYWDNVERIYITVPKAYVTSKDISEGVLKSRENNTLLEAGIN